MSVIKHCASINDHGGIHTPYLLLQKLSKRASCLFAYGFTSRTGYAPYDRAKDAMISRRMFEIKVNKNR
jgi:hypothetical protein